MKNQNDGYGEKGDGGEAEGNFFVLGKPHLRVRNSSDNFASYRRATSAGRAGPSRCSRLKKTEDFHRDGSGSEERIRTPCKLLQPKILMLVRSKRVERISTRRLC